MIICLDHSSKVIMANPITERIFHKPLSSIIGNSIDALGSKMGQYEKII